MLPVGAIASGPAPDTAALVALPIVGAVVGALAGGIGLAAALVVPHAIAAALALGALILLTGALHLDGFLDGCDAFFASVSPERRLEILKDPRHGTFAVAGMFVLGILWFSALAALPPPWYPALLAFAGALARLATVTNAYRYPYARRGAETRAFASRPAPAPLAFQAALLAIAAYAIAPVMLVTLPLALLAALLLGGRIARALGGGLVGDAYGFIIVILEVGTLASFSAAGTYFR